MGIVASVSPAARDTLRLVQEAIRLSTLVLEAEPEQLRAQLLGRLFGNRQPSVKALVEEAGQRNERTWIRPMGRCLTEPSGMLLHILSGHMGRINSLALTSDASRVVSASDDHTLRIWEMKTGQLQAVLHGHTGRVRTLRIVPGTNLAITASSDKTLRIWDLETLAPVEVLEGHIHEIQFAHVSSDGKYAVSGSDREPTKIWDLTTRRVVGELIDSAIANAPGDPQYPGDVTIIPGTTRALTASSYYEPLAIWDLLTRKRVAELLDEYKVPTNTPGDEDQVYQYRVHTYQLRVAPDGLHAITFGGAPSIRRLVIWNLSSLTGRAVNVDYQALCSVGEIAATPDCSRIILARGQQIQVKIVDEEPYAAPVLVHVHTAPVTALEVTADSTRLLSGSADGVIKVWDLSRLEAARDIDQSRHTRPVVGVAISPSGRRAVSLSERAIRLWNTRSPRLVDRIKRYAEGEGFDSVTSRPRIEAFAISLDGKVLVIASSDATLTAFKLGSRKMTILWERPQENEHEGVYRLGDSPPTIGGLTVRSNNRHVITLTRKSIKVWDIANGHLLRVEREREWSSESEDDIRAMPGYDPNIVATGTSRDGHLTALLTDGTRWDVDTRKQLGPVRLQLGVGGRLSYGQYGLAAEADSLYHSDQLAVTPDLRWIVTRSDDDKLCVLDAESGAILHTLADVDHLRAAAMTSDGRLAVTSSADRSVDAWDLRAGKRLARLTLDFPVVGLAITPNGRTVAAADDQGSVFFLALENVDGHRDWY